MTENKQIYDQIAGRYDKAFAPLERWFLARWRGETLAHLAENSKVLEIGAGTGLNFKFYPSKCNGTASEISIKMLEFAKQKIDSKNIKLVQANAENLPFAEDSFDSAFATLVFCSIPNPADVFVELQRVIKPNGKIILLEHVRPTGLLGFLFDFLNIFTVALIEDHFNRQTAKIAENAGLKIVEIKPKAFGIINLIVCEKVK